LLNSFACLIEELYFYILLIFELCSYRISAKKMFSDYPLSGPNAPPCDSRCVEGLARGSLIGLAWTFAHGSELTPHSNPAIRFITTLGRNSFGFASFLGVYSLASCSIEKVRRKDDVYNYFFGGLAVRLNLLLFALSTIIFRLVLLLLLIHQIYVLLLSLRSVPAWHAVFFTRSLDQEGVAVVRLIILVMIRNDTYYIDDNKDLLIILFKELKKNN